MRRDGPDFASMIARPFWMLAYILTFGRFGIDPFGSEDPQEPADAPDTATSAPFERAPCPICGKTDGSCRIKMWRKPCPACKAVGRHVPCVSCGEVFA